MRNEWEDMEVLAQEANFSVTVLADWMGLSPRQFRRRFKRELGVGPGKWMYELRVRLGKEKRSSGGRVKEAAQELFYNHPSNLTRAMRHEGWEPAPVARVSQETGSLMDKLT